MILTEFGPGAKNAALFSGSGLPTAIGIADFSPDALQHRRPGKIGAQHFFRVNGRAFGLYVVLGSGRAAALAIPELNRALGGISIS